MKKLLLAAVALVVLAAGPAVAADLARKAPAYTPPPPPPQPTWTGWYVGGNAGVHWFANNNIDITSPVSLNNPGGGGGTIQNLASAAATVNLSGGDHAGFIGGVQFGRNQQWGNWVFGSENDIQGISNNKINVSTTTVNLTNAGTLTTNINATKELAYLGTARARLGWLATPTFLVYGTGGLAYGGVKSSVDIAQSSSAAPTFGATSGLFDQTLAGWTAGGGVEWLFLPNWSAKVEYLYYNLGQVNFATPDLIATFPNGVPRYGLSPEVSTKFNGNIVRAGINYHFNFP